MIGGVLAGYICDFLANKISVKKEFSAIYQLIVVPLFIDLNYWAFDGICD
jgi:fructose PTS system EIIBC or EIIC component